MRIILTTSGKRVARQSAAATAITLDLIKAGVLKRHDDMLLRHTALFEDEGYIRDWAAGWGCSAATLGRKLKRLEAAGWIVIEGRYEVVGADNGHQHCA